MSNEPVIFEWPVGSGNMWTDEAVERFIDSIAGGRQVESLLLARLKSRLKFGCHGQQLQKGGKDE